MRAPRSHGSPVTGYNLRYRLRGVTEWIDHPFDGVGASTVLTGLTGAANYEAQVQAVSGEGSSPWSDGGYIGAAAPGPDPTPEPEPLTPLIESPGDVNLAPYFAGPETRYVDEGSAANTAVGDPVTATDTESDALTYSISGASQFTIDSGTGQIRVADGVPLNRAAASSHMVTVGVSDGKDGSGAADPAVDATTRVTIHITNAQNPRVAPSITIEGPENPILTPGPFTVTATFSEEPGPYYLATQNLATPLNAQTSGKVVTFHGRAARILYLAVGLVAVPGQDSHQVARSPRDMGGNV